MTPLMDTSTRLFAEQLCTHDKVCLILVRTCLISYHVAIEYTEPTITLLFQRNYTANYQNVNIGGYDFLMQLRLII